MSLVTEGKGECGLRCCSVSDLGVSFTGACVAASPPWEPGFVGRPQQCTPDQLGKELEAQVQSSKPCVITAFRLGRHLLSERSAGSVLYLSDPAAWRFYQGRGGESPVSLVNYIAR